MLPAGCQHRPDIVRQLLQEPFIDQTVDLSGLFVSLIVGVCIVYQADKANAQPGKQTVDVFLHQFHLSGKPGLGLAQNNVKLSCGGVDDEAIELGAASVRTGIVVIAVNIV